MYFDIFWSPPIKGFKNIAFKIYVNKNENNQ